MLLLCKYIAWYNGNLHKGIKFNLFHFSRNIEVRILIFGYAVASTSTIICIKLYGYLQVSLQYMVQHISYWSDWSYLIDRKIEFIEWFYLYWFWKMGPVESILLAVVYTWYIFYVIQTCQYIWYC